MDWYTRNFNIYPSDILYVPEEKVDPSTGKAARKEVALFGSIDRGSTPVDHHTFFMTTTVPGKEKHVHHSSYEVHDFDTQLLGHQWLAEKKYDPVWGVGRISWGVRSLTIGGISRGSWSSIMPMAIWLMRIRRLGMGRLHMRGSRFGGRRCRRRSWSDCSMLVCGEWLLGD